MENTRACTLAVMGAGERVQVIRVVPEQAGKKSIMYNFSVIKPPRACLKNKPKKKYFGYVLSLPIKMVYMHIFLCHFNSKNPFFCPKTVKVRMQNEIEGMSENRQTQG